MDYTTFSLRAWLSHLEAVHAQEIQLGLTRVQAVAERLGLLQWDMPVITVAGTNGKGSTVAALEEIYTSAGYRVAAYTSPHLQHFNERIRVHCEPISDAHLCQSFCAVEQQRQGILLTYFEMTTLAALHHFKSFELDVLILEVGLGGRADATNIISPTVAIITTVDLDHQAFLGETTEAIGYEKAGILRANIPLIYGDTSPPQSVLKEAKRLNAPLFLFGDHYTVLASLTELQIIIKGETFVFPRPNLNSKAASTAFMTTQLLEDRLPVTLAQVQTSMRVMQIKGRLQVMGTEIKTILDVAHNPQAVRLLSEFIEGLEKPGKVHAVFSALQDKDLCGLIKPMKRWVDFWYPALLPGKRAANAFMLQSALQSEDCDPVDCFMNPWAAYQAALQRANPDDFIVVYGSFFTVGPILAQGE